VKKILTQTNRSRTLKSKPINQQIRLKKKKKNIPTNLIHKIQKSKGQESRKQTRWNGAEARSGILNLESLERNDFGGSPFSELWIVVAKIHESYRNFVSFSGDFVKLLKLESKNIKQRRLKKMHLELEGKTRQCQPR
jgi:hypothetical protein